LVIIPEQNFYQKKFSKKPDKSVYQKPALLPRLQPHQAPATPLTIPFVAVVRPLSPTENRSVGKRHPTARVVPIHSYCSSGSKTPLFSPKTGPPVFHPHDLGQFFAHSRLWTAQNFQDLVLVGHFLRIFSSRYIAGFNRPE
jgi:hypothetical protein